MHGLINWLDQGQAGVLTHRFPFYLAQRRTFVPVVPRHAHIGKCTGESLVYAPWEAEAHLLIQLKVLYQIIFHI